VSDLSAENVASVTSSAPTITVAADDARFAPIMNDPTSRIYAVVAISLTVLLVLGYGTGTLLNDALRISFREKTIDSEPALVDVIGRIDPSTISHYEHVVLPEAARELSVFEFAANELAVALHARTGSRPSIVYEGEESPGRRIIVELRGEGDEPLRLRTRGGNIHVSAGRPADLAFGLNHLTAQFYQGWGDGEVRLLDTTLHPALRHRLVDFGAVGEVPDSAAWMSGDYTHHSTGLRRAFLADAPFVDTTVLAKVDEQFRQYIDRMATYGYNGIVIGGFLEYLNFDGVGSGVDVYPDDSPYRERHLAIRRSVEQMLRYADDIGFSVIFATDMLALSRPLEQYLRQRLGSIDPSNPELWGVYEAGVRELFEVMPQIDGLMIRVGEAGSVYNVEGWNYWSTLAVRSPQHMWLMVGAFTRAAEAAGKTIIIRNWTVGVGSIGDMHTSVDTYMEVLGDVLSGSLIVSTKFVAGDFYSYLPLNPTLSIGPHSRIVEFQARREFEGFASFPNFLAPMHQHALRSLKDENPLVDGLWMWTQGGGPVRQSPMSLYPFHGFWHLIDADVYVAGHLAWDVDADVGALTTVWVRRMLGGDEAVVDEVVATLMASRSAVLDGMYVAPFARRQVFALGLEPPPMMWIFEWDILTASTAVLSAIYVTSRGELDTAIADGYRAAEAASNMHGSLAAIDRNSVGRPDVLELLVASVAYESSLFETLAHYRAAFLNYYRWLDTGDRVALSAWREADDRFRASRDAHVAAYRTDLDFRAFNFFDADAGLAHARRASAMIWIARLLFVLVVAVFLAGVLLPSTRRREGPTAGLHLLAIGAFTPWRLPGAPGLRRPEINLLAPAAIVITYVIVLASTSFLSPAVAILAAMVLGGIYVLAAIPRSSEAGAFRLAALSGALLLASLVPLAIIGFRGPPYFWYLFWTSDLFRIAGSTYGVTSVGWILVVLLLAGRTGGETWLRSGSYVAFIASVPLLVTGILSQILGLERALTVMNDQLVILPLGLSRILGITTHLNIPHEIPVYLTSVGVLLVGLGFVSLALSRPKKRPVVVAA
jgi:hypothetical protein